MSLGIHWVWTVTVLCTLGCWATTTLAVAEFANPPLQTFYQDYDLVHSLDKRAVPSMRLRFGKKDMWTVSQRSIPSLRLRFGKRSATDLLQGDESDLSKRGSDRSNLRLRFGKRDQIEEQNDDIYPEVYHDLEQRGGQSNLRLRFGKRDFNYYNEDDSGLSGIEERGGNSALRLRFGKRGDISDYSDLTELYPMSVERRGGGSSSMSRLRFGKRPQESNNFIRALMERRGGRMPSSRLRFGKRDVVEQANTSEEQPDEEISQ